MTEGAKPLQELLENWPFVASFVAFVAGYTNLKADHRSLRRDFDAAQVRLDKQRADDNKLLRDALDQLREDAKITQADVKTLLQRRV